MSIELPIEVNAANITEDAYGLFCYAQFKTNYYSKVSTNVYLMMYLLKLLHKELRLTL